MEIHAQNHPKSADQIKTELRHESNTNANTRIHTCRHCDCLGYDIIFCNSDLLERYTIDRHPGWTTYPGPADLEKYKRERMERGQSTNG
jgi:hypothetical protein